MIIGSNQKGTVRENINNLKGEKDNNDYSPLGNHFKKDDPISNLKSQIDNLNIDPDDRGLDDESNWKDFY